MTRRKNKSVVQQPDYTCQTIIRKKYRVQVHLRGEVVIKKYPVVLCRLVFNIGFN